MKSRVRFVVALTVVGVMCGLLLYLSIGGALQNYVSPAELMTSPLGGVYR
jgi:hypothetical protein